MAEARRKIEYPEVKESPILTLMHEMGLSREKPFLTIGEKGDSSSINEHSNCPSIVLKNKDERVLLTDGGRHFFCISGIFAAKLKIEQIGSMALTYCDEVISKQQETSIPLFLLASNLEYPVGVNDSLEVIKRRLRHDRSILMSPEKVKTILKENAEMDISKDISGIVIANNIGIGKLREVIKIVKNDDRAVTPIFIGQSALQRYASAYTLTQSKASIIAEREEVETEFISNGRVRVLKIC